WQYFWETSAGYFGSASLRSGWPCLWERAVNERIGYRASAAIIWRNDARRCLVAPTAARVFGIVDLHSLFYVGRVSGRALLFRQLCLAILFAGTFWQFASCVVRAETHMVAGVAVVFTGAVHSLGSRRIPSDVLLLPRRVLQGFLG